MAVPVGKYLQAFVARVFQGGELLLRGKREMLRRVVDVLHRVVLCHGVAIWAFDAQQVTARLVGCILPGLSD